MRRFRKVVAISAALSVAAGCTVMHKDFENFDKEYKKVDLHLLAIGDSKHAVVSKLGDPENVLGAKRFKDGMVEVWEYASWKLASGPDIKEAYWLYFWNDSLEQWGRPGDWEKEADRIYEIRLR